VSQEPEVAKPVMNYKLRSTQDGEWLWRISVTTKNGVPFQLFTWTSVATPASQYHCRPQFSPLEKSAWIGSLSAAQSLQLLLVLRWGSQTDIVNG